MSTLQLEISVICQCWKDLVKDTYLNGFTTLVMNAVSSLYTADVAETPTSLEARERVRFDAWVSRKVPYFYVPTHHGCLMFTLLHYLINFTYISTAEGPSASSPCLRHEIEARRNKRLGVFVPKCRPDGGYDEKQCHGSICFCMDQEGREMSGTRVYRQRPLNCSAVSQSPKGRNSFFLLLLCICLHI